MYQEGNARFLYISPNFSTQMNVS